MISRRQLLERIVALGVSALGSSCNKNSLNQYVPQHNVGIIPNDDASSPVPEGSDCSTCYDSIHDHDDPEQVVGMSNQEISSVEESSIGYILHDPQDLNEDGIPIYLENEITRHEMLEGDNLNIGGIPYCRNEFSVFRFSDAYIVHQGGTDHYFEIDLRNLDPPIPEGEIPADVYDLGREIAHDFLHTLGIERINDYDFSEG